MYTLISFLLSLFFITLGIISLIIPWSSYARTELITFLLENNILLTFFGFTLLALGLIALFYLIQNSKRKYFTIKSSELEADVSETVISKYLSTYFRELYPLNDVACKVELKKKKAVVIADLPYVPENEQKELLKKIEEDLTDLFRDVIGFRHELKVSVSFSPN